MNYKKEYRRLHKDDLKFRGFSIVPHVPRIAKLVKKTGARSLLDYGSGKGLQYTELRVHDRWGGILPTCYDIGINKLSKRPKRPSDGVICTDVMEHIDEPDIDYVLREIFTFATKFAFFAICTRPSKKAFKDGRNVHLTVQNLSWWENRIASFVPEDRPFQLVIVSGAE
jgi:hypothetical protein